MQISRLTLLHSRNTNCYPHWFYLAQYGLGVYLGIPMQSRKKKELQDPDLEEQFTVRVTLLMETLQEQVGDPLSWGGIRL